MNRHHATLQCLSSIPLDQEDLIRTALLVPNSSRPETTMQYRTLSHLLVLYLARLDGLLGCGCVVTRSTRLKG